MAQKQLKQVTIPLRDCWVVTLRSYKKQLRNKKFQLEKELKKHNIAIMNLNTFILKI
ncbi:hypothetical protein PROPEN_02740 [Proteus penneri ATCC 35198]|nr:hypothetical protein PROPEN_02740 [Proteus penneri ATCC 35198]